MAVLGDLNARVGNEFMGIVGQHRVPRRNESGERLLEMCAEQELVVGNSWFKKKDEYKYMCVENGRRNGGRQGIDGLCIATKTNAWKTVRCESVERRRWRNVLPFFGGGSAEIGGWREVCREDGGCEKCVEGE